MKSISEILTFDKFVLAVPCTPAIAKFWYAATIDAMNEFAINTEMRIAGYIAQTSMECRRYTQFVENMNYSVQRLANTWPSRFAVDPKAKVKVPNSTAWMLGRSQSRQSDPKGIANFVYGSRGGNRPGTDDGWLYRGRGPKMITFHYNYLKAGKGIGVDLAGNPDLLTVPVTGCRAAGWYWATHGCNELMDANKYEDVTRAINGGLIGHEDGNTTGLDDRVELFDNAQRVILGV